MKKSITLFLALLLLISLCACDFEPMIPGKDQQSEIADGQQTDNTNESQTGSENAPADTEYKLTVIDYWGYLIEPLDEYYKAGEEVEVKLAFLSGPEVGIELNGEYIRAQSATKHDGIYPIITFTMPARDSVLYTTMNGNVGFKSTFSRAGSGRDPDIYLNALNASKLNVNDGNLSNLPIYKFDTLADLEKFKSDFGGESGFNYGWDEVPSFNDATQYYDETFFERYTLMLVYIDVGSGSYRFGFKDVAIVDNYLCIQVEQTNDPKTFTDDEAAWFITVVVPDSMIANITEFNAVFIPYGIQEGVPDDFSFALTWNVFGISSYDSHTGKLVKTTDATNPDDYVTYYQLTDAEMEYVYGLILSLDVYSYPDIYDPGNGQSDPSATLILTVRVDDEEKTIKAEHISLFYVSGNEKGQLFLDTCRAISNLLTSTDEWKALPDYENLYE